MKKTIIFTLSLMIGVCMCLAEEYETPDNFKGIKFGSSKEVLHNKLKEDKLLRGHQDIDYFIRKEFIQIENFFKIGDLSVTVIFYFYEDKFYQFEFQTKLYAADKLSLVKKDANYLADIFKNKYGPWKSKFDPSIIDISSDAVSFTHKWLFPKQTVFIGLTEYEFEYYAIARVYDDDIRKDKIEGIKSKSKSSAKDAVDDF